MRNAYKSHKTTKNNRYYNIIRAKYAVVKNFSVNWHGYSMQSGYLVVWLNETINI